MFWLQAMGDVSLRKVPVVGADIILHVCTLSVQTCIIEIYDVEDGMQAYTWWSWV